MEGQSQPRLITQEEHHSSWKRVVIYDPEKRSLTVEKEQTLQG